jgi:hypothetical protein
MEKAEVVSEGDAAMSRIEKELPLLSVSSSEPGEVKGILQRLTPRATPDVSMSQDGSEFTA